MAGFRKPGPWGFEELPPSALGLPPSARYSSPSPAGVDADATPLAAPAEAELPSFRFGGHRYRIHDPNHGATAGDEERLTGKDAQQVLDQVAPVAELAWTLTALREAVTGRRLILLRLRAPAAAAPTPSAPEPAPPPRAAPRQEPKSWIEIEVVDGDGKPREGCSYRLDLPDGRTMQGKLGSKGLISVHGIDPGSATLTLIESS